MTHTMNDKEYVQYLKDKEELEEYRILKKEFPERIQSYFNRIKQFVEEKKIDLRYPVGFCILTYCQQEQRFEGYCDMCPIGFLFNKCPLGHYKEYSK